MKAKSDNDNPESGNENGRAVMAMSLASGEDMEEQKEGGGERRRKRRKGERRRKRRGGERRRKRRRGDKEKEREKKRCQSSLSTKVTAADLPITTNPPFLAHGEHHLAATRRIRSEHCTDHPMQAQILQFADLEWNGIQIAKTKPMREDGMQEVRSVQHIEPFPEHVK